MGTAQQIYLPLQDPGELFHRVLVVTGPRFRSLVFCPLLAITIKIKYTHRPVDVP